jgi:hypothetical protein
MEAVVENELAEEIAEALAPAELSPVEVQQPVNIVDGKPELILPNDHTSFVECGEQCFRELAKTGRFFRQGTVIVELAGSSEGTKLVELTVEAFRSRLDTYFTLRSFVILDGRRALRPKRCSQDNAKALLATEATLKYLPAIQAVVNSPVFAEDEGVDGVEIHHESTPARYKHQRYFLDGGLVDLFLTTVLNPKKIVQRPFLSDFKIENVYLEANLPVQPTEAERVATQKLIDAALKLDSRLFKYKTKAAIPGNALVSNLCGGENKDSENDYRFSSRLGSRWSEQYIDFTTAVETVRGELANLLQIRLARLILDDSPKSKVVISTTFQPPPHATANATLLVDISIPKSKIASDDAYKKIARWLADAAIKVSSEISGNN